MEDIDPKKLLFCVATACSESEQLMNDLINLHDLLESSDKMDTKFELLGMFMTELFSGFEDFAKQFDTSGENMSPEEFSASMVKANKAYIWLMRLDMAVRRWTPVFDIVEQANMFNEAINTTNQFLQDNQ